MDIRSFVGKRDNFMKTLVAVLGMAILVVVLFSAVFVTTRKHHHCHGEDCPVCAVLHQCESGLGQLGSGLIPRAGAVRVGF